PRAPGWHDYAVAGLPDVSFRDAEVVPIRLDRAGPTLEMSVEVLAGTEHAALWELRFGQVADLELHSLNEQNALFDLRADRGDDGVWHVRAGPSYGGGATLD